GDRGKRPARHHYKLATHGFDRLDLFFVGADDVVDAHPCRRSEMIGPHPAADLDARTPLRGFQRMTDQFARTRPIKPAATSGGVHRFGHAKSKIPEIVASDGRRLPTAPRT